MSQKTSKSDDDYFGPPWQLFAKCKGLPPEWFVPSRPGGSLARVVAICHGRDGQPVCPVMAECERAGELNDEIGVWGGKVRSTKRTSKPPADREITPVRMNIQDARPKRTSPVAQGEATGLDARGPKPEGKGNG